MSDDNSLERFVSAQAYAYDNALNEIKSGRKRSHWMWYIFPQLQGLGYSSMAKRYGITNLDEAARYLNHPLLGPRLIEISTALTHLKSDDATAIMGSPDDLKLHSSMTLFSLVPGSDLVFEAVLKKFYHGKKDAGTLRLL